MTLVFFLFHRVIAVVCREPGEGRIVQDAVRDVRRAGQSRFRHVQQGVSGLRAERPREEALCHQARQADHAPGEVTT